MTTTLTTRRGKKSVYMRRGSSLGVFAWLGNCSRLAGIESPRGDLTPTYCRAEQVGKYITDQLIRGAPGPSTTSLIMKESVRNAIYNGDLDCAFDLDVRAQSCGYADDPNNWDMIRRLCGAQLTSISTDDETSMSPEDEGETLITAAVSSLTPPVTIYKVAGQRVAEQTFINYTLDNISVLKPAQCSDECGPETQCTLIAVAVKDTPANPPTYALSTDGGTTWTVYSITAFAGATNLTDIAGVGDFIVAVASGEPGYAYSWDGGTTWALVDDTQVASFSANHPLTVTVRGFNNVVLGGENGYIWQSINGGVSVSILDAGIVTISDIRQIRFANDNVIYAVGADNTAKKSSNAGRTWDSLTMPSAKAGDDIYTVLPITDQIVLVGYANGDGGLYNSLDGGATWTLDNSIPSTSEIYDLSMCDCGVVYAAVTDTAGNQGIVYRNVDYGAPARWTVVEVDDPGEGYTSVVCCDANHALAVGAASGVYTSGILTLIE